MNARERAKQIATMRETAADMRRNPKKVDDADKLLAQAERLRIEGYEQTMKETEPPPSVPVLPASVVPVEDLEQRR